MYGTPAIRFFYKHAPWSYDPQTETKQRGRWRCARELANAERWAQEHDVTFTWEHDPDTDLGDHAYWCDDERKGTCSGHAGEQCLANGQQSLGGIIDADSNYRRVVEAELAAELMDEWEQMREFTEQEAGRIKA